MRLICISIKMISKYKNEANLHIYQNDKYQNEANLHILQQYQNEANLHVNLICICNKHKYEEI